jgi:hypothetical protein
LILSEQHHPVKVIRKISMYYRIYMAIEGHTLSKLCIEAKSKGFEKPAGGTP